MPRPKTIIAIYTRKSKLLTKGKDGKLNDESFSNRWHIKGNKLVSLNEEIYFLPLKRLAKHG